VFSLELYILLSMVGAVLKSVDAVNKKQYNSVILLYLKILNNFLLSRHTHHNIEYAIAMKSNPI